jgi:hypothetical protein
MKAPDAPGHHCRTRKAGCPHSARACHPRLPWTTPAIPGAKAPFLTGDASLRAYEARLRPDDGVRRILMDWPPLPEGPPVLDGKPYPKVAHLAENAYPFVAIAEALAPKRALRAPEIYRVDYDARHPADRGSRQRRRSRRRRHADCRALSRKRRVPCASACAADAAGYRGRMPCPPYSRFRPYGDEDGGAPVLDWHLPWKRGEKASDAEREEYLAIWDELIDQLTRHREEPAAARFPFAEHHLARAGIRIRRVG